MRGLLTLFEVLDKSTSVALLPLAHDCASPEAARDSQSPEQPRASSSRRGTQHGTCCTASSVAHPPRRRAGGEAAALRRRSNRRAPPRGFNDSSQAGLSSAHGSSNRRRRRREPRSHGEQVAQTLRGGQAWRLLLAPLQQQASSRGAQGRPNSRPRPAETIVVHPRRARIRRTAA